MRHILLRGAAKGSHIAYVPSKRRLIRIHLRMMVPTCRLSVHRLQVNRIHWMHGIGAFGLMGGKHGNRMEDDMMGGNVGDISRRRGVGGLVTLALFFASVVIMPAAEYAARV